MLLVIVTCLSFLSFAQNTPDDYVTFTRLRTKIGRQLRRSDNVAGQSRFEAKTPQQSGASVGAAGLSLTLAGGASAAITQPTADMTARQAPVTQEITLAEEELSGVSLATFHVFDEENAGKPQHGPRFAMAAGGCAGCAGCGGCGCWTGTYYTSPVIGNGGYDPPRPVRPAHKYARPAKRTGQ